jgi:hypothetical protein
MEVKFAIKSGDIDINVTLNNISQSDVLSILKAISDSSARKAFQNAFNISIHPYFRDDE